MKHLLLLSIVLLTVIGCEKKGQILDPDAVISIRPEQPTKSETTNPLHLTPKEIVHRATDIWFWNTKITESNSLGRAFAPAQRDTVNLRLMMWGEDIVNSNDGTLNLTTIEGTDFLLTEEHEDLRGADTVAYLKNVVIRSAEAQIKEAYEKGDYETVYKVFDEAFTFLPITGKEWLELKKQNLN